jgi:hypothetical protein
METNELAHFNRGRNCLFLFRFFDCCRRILSLILMMRVRSKFLMLLKQQPVCRLIQSYEREIRLSLLLCYMHCYMAIPMARSSPASCFESVQKAKKLKSRSFDLVSLTYKRSIAMSLLCQCLQAHQEGTTTKSFPTTKLSLSYYLTSSLLPNASYFCFPCTLGIMNGKVVEVLFFPPNRKRKSF